ncbi:Ig-like domain-containing protein [Sediminitomix flava]|uniref:Putative secreted protein (Por secretion system target) n=1 Tax=Sediminitomix flava TaxID=379075 RepID=A0A315ZAQ9_SEDFL|nr:Ig-like domain-containing protein [Sediminitomix flava]PWJ41804.1 putative secreted protein (Por secretion system target) [Sediminitomix flava]
MKQNFISVLALLCIALNAFAQNQPLTAKEGENWVIKWNRSDDFNGTSVNRSMWNPNVSHVGVWSWDNDNVTVSNGTAKIKVTQENHTRTFWDGCNGKQVQNFELYYKSGILKSFATGTYGYYEAKIKGADLFPGVCPAFWLYSSIDRSLTSPGDVQYSEIDIVEMQQGDTDHGFGNNPKGMEHNLHTIVVNENGTPTWHRPKAYPEENMNLYEAPFDPRNDFHIYGCEVTKEKITWYVDGVKVGEKENLYWHRPMNVTFSVGLRRQFTEFRCNQFYPNAANTTTQGFPTTMEIDYVRVWEKEESNTPIGVTGVSLSPASSSISVGASTTFSASVMPSNASNKSVSWSSSNTSVATVSQAGVVSGVGVGNATITVTTNDGNFKASSTVSVSTGNEVGGDIFLLKNKHQGQIVHPVDNSEGAKISYSTSNTQVTDKMKWEKIATNGVNFRLKNVASGKYLSAASSSSASVLTQSSSLNPSTEWKMVAASGGYSYFENQSNGNYFRPHSVSTDVIERPNTVTNYSTQWILEEVNAASRKSTFLESEVGSALKLSPNPVSNQLKVNGLSKKNSLLEIYDVQGDIFYSEQVQGLAEVTISVSEFPVGVYILNVSNDMGCSKLKFVKE